MGAVDVASIDAVLPQTQCTRCGYPDCRHYAQAIADGTEDINRCPPGGQEGIARLASLTGRPMLELHPEVGAEGPLSLARIDEAWCIGCTVCMDVCPVDAIVGSNKLMHTVLPHACTGCDLCVPVCPVDCIEMIVETPGRTGWQAWSPAQARDAQLRYQARTARLANSNVLSAERLEAKARNKLAHLEAESRHKDPTVLDAKRGVIEAALARARARRSGP